MFNGPVSCFVLQHFFFLIKDYGSWLDIGTRYSIHSLCIVQNIYIWCRILKTVVKKRSNLYRNLSRSNLILEASKRRKQQWLLAFRGETRPSSSCVGTLPAVLLGRCEGRRGLRGTQGSRQVRGELLESGLSGGLTPVSAFSSSLSLSGRQWTLQVAVWIFCCSLHFRWSSCASWNLQCGDILTRDPCNIITSSIIWTKSQSPPYCDLNIKDGHSLLNFFSLRGRKWGWFFYRSVFKCSQR